MRTKIAKSIVHFIVRVARSRLGQILFVIHLFLIVADSSSKPAISPNEVDCVIEGQWSSTLIAGRNFHFHYESGLLQILIVLDLPGILLSLLIAGLLTPIFMLFPELCAYTESWIVAIIFLIGTSIQWWLLGYGIEHFARSMKNRPET